MAARHSNGTRCANNNGHAPAVAYLRASSDRQETSVPDQRKAVAKYAETHGYHLIGEYVDDGISGDATAKREAFQKMIADADRGQFQAIIVWDQDRFGRFDSVEAGFWIHPLRSAGVTLVTVAEGAIDWNDFTGRLMYSIKQEGKHQFLRDLARNTARGRHEAAKSGTWMAKAPYGFVKDQAKRLQLADAVEVETVRRIFREYLAGHSVRSICRTLNAEGIPSPRGREWQASGIASMLNNTAYTGDFVWNRHRKGKYIGIEADGLTADVRRGTSNAEDWITFQDHHPAIVDRDTFEQVQKRLTERKTKTTPHRDGGRYLFTGLIRCGKCGGAMVGLSRDRLRYNCSNAKHSDTCDINTVFQDELADIVLTEVRKRFIDGDTMDRLKAELIRQSTTKGQDVKAMRRQLDQTSRKLEKAKRRLIEVDRDLLDIVQEEVRSLRDQHEHLQAAVKAAESPQDQRQADIDTKVSKALASLTRLHQVFQKADPVLQREVMQQTVSRIEVVSERDWSTKRGLFRLQRGAIHLRGDLLNNLSNTSECSPPSSH